MKRILFNFLRNKTPKIGHCTKWNERIKAFIWWFAFHRRHVSFHRRQSRDFESSMDCGSPKWLFGVLFFFFHFCFRFYWLNLYSRQTKNVANENRKIKADHVVVSCWTRILDELFGLLFIRLLHVIGIGCWWRPLMWTKVKLCWAFVAFRAAVLFFFSYNTTELAIQFSECRVEFVSPLFLAIEIAHANE